VITPPSRYDLDRAQLTALLDGEPPYRVDQIWHGLYGELAEPAAITTLSKSLRTRLETDPAMRSALDTVVLRTADDEQTVKWLFQLHDGRRIETVLMHYPDRSTACVSSQAGCAMNCSFCATGQAGFDRNLSVGEIVEQVVFAQRRALQDGRRLSNLVFMGMGEPLANIDRLWPAIQRIHDDLGFGARHITVSTVGVVPGIRRMTAEPLPVNLAVSLHAANDELRNQLVPLNKRYPLDVLVEACRAHIEAKGRRLSFEWALIHDVNDRVSDAAELSAIALDLGAHVNVIPLNPTPGYAVRGSGLEAVRRFVDELLKRGVNATIRTTRGVDIDAACGQLAANSVTVPAPVRRVTATEAN
jgi:23S rRNA (adenine2503-C2)-methyltransferase